MGVTHQVAKYPTYAEARTEWIETHGEPTPEQLKAFEQGYQYRGAEVDYLWETLADVSLRISDAVYAQGLAEDDIESPSLKAGE